MLLFIEMACFSLFSISCSMRLSCSSVCGGGGGGAGGGGGGAGGCWRCWWFVQ